MKGWICRVTALAAALLMLCSAACAETLGGQIAYGRLVECARELYELAYGDFMTLKNVPWDVQSVAQDWTAAYSGEPALVVRLDVYGSAHVLQYRAVFKSEHPLVSLEAQSTGVGEIINGALTMAAYDSLQPQAAYTRMMHVHNALNFNEMYADADIPEGGQLYVLLYEEGEPLFILSNAENGAVSLTTYIIPSMSLAECRTYADVAMWFMRWGCPISGDEVRPE